MSIINVVDINLSPCIIGLEFGAWVAACRPDPARSIRQREGLCRLPLSATCNPPPSRPSDQTINSSS